MHSKRFGLIAGLAHGTDGVNAADLLGMSGSIGTLEAGKQADLIALDSSPLENIEALLDVDFVMKSGKVYKRQ